MPSLYRIYERDLDPDDITVEEGIRVVAPRLSILDGLDRHLDARLIRQAIDTARARGLIGPPDLVKFEEVTR